MHRIIYIIIPFLMMSCKSDANMAMERGIQYYKWNQIDEAIIEFSKVKYLLDFKDGESLESAELLAQAHYNLGDLDFTPSFTPGLYHEGDGKDLGHVIEFKTEVQFSINTSADTKLGFSYNHVSNASLGSKNPGANSYIFNFFKKF